MSLLDVIARWGQSRVAPRGDVEAQAAALAAWHQTARAFWPQLVGASPETGLARSEWRRQLRLAHQQFLRQHGDRVFNVCGADLDTVLSGIGARWPFLLADRAELEADARRPLREKAGFEYMSAILISELLAHPRFGQELIDLMRRPRGTSAVYLSEFLRHDHLELPGARLSRQGPVATLEVSSPWTLNAEDESVLTALEACVDVALLDERIQVGVLRGAPVLNRKYSQRRVFCSGLNLTALYEGRLPYRYYVQRELGLVNKLYRGVVSTSDGADCEKPWIAGVDAHAIGGGCQLLLVMDHVIAAHGSVVSLPAGKEGILPGAASLRLARMVGERCARRALMLDQPLLDETVRTSPLVDQMVPQEAISTAIASVADAWVEAGSVSLVSHRKALRLVQEPVDQFRSYMSYFALAQADCHFGTALARNLERNWVSRNGRQQATSAAEAPAAPNA